MPQPESDLQFQKAVLWEPTGTDANGNPTYVDATYSEINVRFTRRKQLSFSTQGAPLGIISELRVDQSIAIHSRIWLGKKQNLPSDLTTVQLYEVVDYSEVPDIKAEEFSRRVVLQRLR